MPEATLTLVPFPDDSSLTSEGQGFNVEVEVMESLKKGKETMRKIIAKFEFPQAGAVQR